MSQPRRPGRSLRRLRLGLLALLAAALVLSPLAAGAAGDLDPSFGSGGKVVTDLGANERALATAIQPDGKIVVAGQDIDGRRFRDFLVVRYGVDGSLDSSFGAGGHVRTDFGGSDWVEGVLIQPDGKIVAAGFASGRFGVVRYNADGTLDGSFGEGGKAWTAVEPGDFSSAAAVALQADGKIVVAGQVRISSGDSDLALVRYNPDGGLDGGFGAGGQVITAFTPASDFAFGVAVEPGGKIIVAGTAGRTSDLFGDAALASYNPDGSLDTSFGAGGKVTTPGSDYIGAFALQPDSKILLAGQSLIRYMRNGSIDTGFGADGRSALTNVAARAVAVQADGKIVAAGTNAGPNYDFTVLRFKPNGEPDESFAGGAGMTTTDIGSSSYDGAWSVNFQSDGKIVVAGETGRAYSDRLDFAVVRFLNPAPPQAANCVVPNVRGKTLAAARRGLAKRHCAVGKVTRKTSTRVKKGRVISQGRRPGARLPNRSKVNLVISRGRQ